MIQCGFPPNGLCSNGRLALHYFLEDGIPERRKEKREEEDDVTWLPLFRALLKDVDVSYILPSPPRGLFCSFFEIHIYKEREEEKERVCVYVLWICV